MSFISVESGKCKCDGCGIVVPAPDCDRTYCFCKKGSPNKQIRSTSTEKKMGCGCGKNKRNSASKAKTAQPQSSPSLIEKAGNLAKAVSKRVMSGGQNVTAQQRQERLKICQENKCGKYNNGICNACGCFLAIKTKWASEDCPEGLWPKLDK